MTFKIPSDWKLNQDGSYDVKGDVKFKNKDLVGGKFPVKFGKVGGEFYCVGCTDLTTLEGAPQSVGRDFNCRGCTGLTTLEGAPQSVGGNFNCVGCKGLKTLEGAPRSVGGYFNCLYCEGLKSLLGAPQSVGGDFSCRGCLVLKSLEWAPQSVGGDFDCGGCTGLKSLEGIEHIKGIETFYIPPNLESHVLGLFYTGCKTVKGGEPWVQVVNQYLPSGPKGASKCSIDLIKAGYKELAQL